MVTSEGKLRLVIVGLLTTHLLARIWLAVTDSSIPQEPAHLAAGLTTWQLGRLRMDRVKPPLLRTRGTGAIGFFCRSLGRPQWFDAIVASRFGEGHAIRSSPHPELASGLARLLTRSIRASAKRRVLNTARQDRPQVVAFTDKEPNDGIRTRKQEGLNEREPARKSRNLVSEQSAPQRHHEIKWGL